MALAKAAIQTAQRAMFTAQLASQALSDVALTERDAELNKTRCQDAAMMAVLRDGLLDAFGAIPKATRERMSACKATLTSDELIDLLALSVQG
jgi:hypothetical protein